MNSNSDLSINMCPDCYGCGYDTDDSMGYSITVGMCPTCDGTGELTPEPVTPECPTCCDSCDVSMDEPEIQSVSPDDYPELQEIETLEKIQPIVNQVSERQETLELSVGLKQSRLNQAKQVVQQMETDIWECVDNGYDTRTVLKWMMNHVGDLQDVVGLERMSPDEFDKLFKDDTDGQ